MFCPDCGGELEEISTFQEKLYVCLECGSEFSEDSLKEHDELNDDSEDYNLTDDDYYK